MFKKGNRNGKGGKTKKQREIEGIAQLALQPNKSQKNKAVVGLLEIAEDKDEKACDRSNAWRILMGYAYGNPRQRTELTGKDGAPLDVRGMPDAEMHARIAELRAKKK